jgi:hypothetical protein
MTLRASQNGWPIIPTIEQCKQWMIPGTDIRLPLRKGAAGFVLVHVALWFHEVVESLEKPMGDDFGWAARFISGSNVPSNHWSGTAMDLNASLHPQGRHTFDQEDVDLIQDRLAHVHYGGAVKWGGDFTTTVDEMHFELQSDLAQTISVANILRETPRGRRIMGAN